MQPLVNAHPVDIGGLHFWTAMALSFEDDPIVASGAGSTREEAMTKATNAWEDERARREREVVITALAGNDSPRGRRRR